MIEWLKTKWGKVAAGLTLLFVTLIALVSYFSNKLDFVTSLLNLSNTKDKAKDLDVQVQVNNKQIEQAKTELKENQDSAKDASKEEIVDFYKKRGY